MNKPPRPSARPLAHFIRPCLGPVLARQGFASADLITHWAEIVGADIAEHTEPVKIAWPRAGTDGPGTLLLRVEGPVALEIQHASSQILERINRFFGWRAIAQINLRQAPLTRRRPPPAKRAPDPAVVSAVEGRVADIADEGLRAALTRLGVATREQR